MADTELVLPISALVSSLGLGGTAIYNGGKLAGRVDALGERTDKLESKQDRNVSREELDARFAALSAKIDAVIQILESRS